MPTGFSDSLTPVAAFVEWLQPGRVLDVGVGSGRMGFLSREYGHLPWHPRARQDGIIVDGIEGYEPYLGDLQRAIYDDIFVGEANEILERMIAAGTRYDLVIAADVLEHFSKEGGALFLERCLQVGQTLLIATPSWYFGQEIAENPLETHRSFWSIADLRRHGATAILHRGPSTVCLFGSTKVASSFTESQRKGGRWFNWVLPSAWEHQLRVGRDRLRARRDRRD